jgi:hypothetical protein
MGASTTTPRSGLVQHPNGHSYAGARAFPRQFIVEGVYLRRPLGLGSFIVIVVDFCRFCSSRCRDCMIHQCPDKEWVMSHSEYDCSATKIRLRLYVIFQRRPRDTSLLAWKTWFIKSIPKQFYRCSSINFDTNTLRTTQSAQTTCSHAATSIHYKSGTDHHRASP